MANFKETFKKINELRLANLYSMLILRINPILMMMKQSAISEVLCLLAYVMSVKENLLMVIFLYRLYLTVFIRLIYLKYKNLMIILIIVMTL